MKGAVALCFVAGAVEAQAVGEVAQMCIDGGRAPGPCFGEETAVWEARIAAATEGLRSFRPIEERNSGGLELSDHMRPSLERAAEALEVYRTELCGSISEVWPGTSDAGVAWAECRMRVTAEHALQLERVLEAFE